jgi:hypothetical protein
MDAMSKASYGNSRSSGVSGKIIVIGVVVVLVAAGIFIWSQWRDSSDADVSGTAAGFEAASDSSIQMKLDITRDDTSAPAYCVVTAMNYDKAEVGRREAVVAGGGSGTTRLIVDIPTHERAVAADVYGCSSVFPSYLDDHTTTDDSTTAGK